MYGACVYRLICSLLGHEFSVCRAGIIEASNIELIVLRGKRYLGVICSMKESFGFIERGDVVGEIFFHFTEYRGNIDQLSVGDDVEFSIQMWNVSILSCCARLALYSVLSLLSVGVSCDNMQMSNIAAIWLCQPATRDAQCFVFIYLSVKQIAILATVFFLSPPVV